MYLAYIDESGRPSRNDPENFVLAALIIQENDWQMISNKFKGVKLRHFPALPDEEVELHIKEMVNREGIFRGMPLDRVFLILDDVFQLLNSIKDDVCIISVIVDKKKMKPGKDIELWGYRLLVERINLFLEKENEKLIAAGMAPQYGIMIIDSINKKVDQLIRNKIVGMMRHGTYYSDLGYLIEDPLFTDSKWRNLSQLVDCVAYCVRRYDRGPDLSTFQGKKWDGYFNLLLPAIDRSEDGDIHGYGYKKFP